MSSDEIGRNNVHEISLFACMFFCMDCSVCDLFYFHSTIKLMGCIFWFERTVSHHSSNVLQRQIQTSCTEEKCCLVMRHTVYLWMLMRQILVDLPGTASHASGSPNIVSNKCTNTEMFLVLTFAKMDLTFYLHLVLLVIITNVHILCSFQHDSLSKKNIG